MPIIAKVNKAAPVSAGVHQAICYSVVDCGTQPPFPGSKFAPSRKVVLTFELPDETITLERDGKPTVLPRAISATFGLSLGKKANLRRELESWRGRNFTDEELRGFDLKNILGKNCQLNVVHENRNGETYANIKNIMPLGKGMTVATEVNPQLYFSLDDFLAAAEKVWPSNMPEWLQGKIQQSDEYLTIMQREDQPAQPVGDAGEKEVKEDDVPF
jgi:hypothetical protein